MILIFNVPNIFVPKQKDFQIYCALKLYKGNFITKEEAIKMCGYSEINEINLKKFDELCILFEKRYIKMCGDGYADSDFLDDMEIESPKKGRKSPFQVLPGISQDMPPFVPPSLLLTEQVNCLFLHGKKRGLSDRTLIQETNAP